MTFTEETLTNLLGTSQIGDLSGLQPGSFMEVVKRERPAEAYRNLLVLRMPNKILDKDET